jgi:hypothetical protein
MVDFDIRKRINEGYYRNIYEYPRMPKKPISVSPECATTEEFKAYKLKLEAYKIEVEECEKFRKEWGKWESKVIENFRNDALDSCGLTGHPKADRAWYLAWEKGHSSGFDAILEHLSDLSELLLN